MTAPVPIVLWVILGFVCTTIAFLGILLVDGWLDKRRADDLLPTDDVMAVADAVQSLFTDDDIRALRAVRDIQASEVTR